MTSEELVTTLGNKLGIFLELEDGVCGLSIDGDEISIEDNEYGLFLIASLASSVDKEQACDRLLRANYLGSQSNGCTISLDEEHDEFVLHLNIIGEISYEVFEQRLQSFVQALKYWKEWLELYNNNEAVSTEPQTDNLNMLQI